MILKNDIGIDSNTSGNLLNFLIKITLILVYLLKYILMP